MGVTKKEFQELGWKYDSEIDGGCLYVHSNSRYPIEYYLMYSGQVIDMYMTIHNNKSYNYYGPIETKEQLEQLMKMLQFI